MRMWVLRLALGLVSDSVWILEGVDLDFRMKRKGQDNGCFYRGMNKRFCTYVHAETDIT